MPEILDLGMTDEEYLHLVEQGIDPVQEQIRAKNLIRAGVPASEAYQIAPLLKKLDLSPSTVGRRLGYHLEVVLRSPIEPGATRKSGVRSEGDQFHVRAVHWTKPSPDNGFGYIPVG